MSKPQQKNLFLSWYPFTESKKIKKKKNKKNSNNLLYNVYSTYVYRYRLIIPFQPISSKKKYPPTHFSLFTITRQHEANFKHVSL